jgi:chondroitin AC lyase
MMNLELLFEATRISGDDSFQKIAVQHANTTMKNHYRDDFSCFHVVNYDTLSGQVLDRATNQGLADASSWARGQAWGLYGFVICYRYTKDAKFLEFAEGIADYIINHPNLPDDRVPYWDFNAGEGQLVPEWDVNASEFSMQQRDASAAAIISSALFELSAFSPSKGDEYAAVASEILESLASPAYMPIQGNNKYFIIDHCVGSIPHNAEVDVPLVYADYYFLEAVKRKKDLAENGKI